MKNITVKVEWFGIRPEKEKIKKNLYCYDLRDAETCNGYTVERYVGINNIGSLVTDVDILNGKEYITDVELCRYNLVEAKLVED